MLLGGKTRAELAASVEKAADEQPAAPTPDHPSDASSAYPADPPDDDDTSRADEELAGATG